MRRITPALTIAVALFVAACTSTPSHQALIPLASPTAAPTPSPGESLLAVVEARGAGSHYGALPGLGDAYDVVAIAGYDGFARARQTFKPRAVPALPGGGTPLLPPPAAVAAGTVFYADGDGVVRRLERSGSVTQVADFATSGQQELWFAVSPDGTQLAATIVTVPAAGRAWTLDIKTATAGGPIKTIKHEDLGTAVPQPLLVVGWDAGGPLVTVHSALVGSTTTSGWEYHGSALAHLLASGDAGPPLGGAGCTPWSSAPDGSILCGGSPATVRDPAGNVIWTLPAGSYALAGRALSPDAQHVSGDTIMVAAGGWADRLPDGFIAEGWVDPMHLLGQAADPAGKGHLQYVTVDNALKPHDLGFTGVVVGGIA